MLQHPKINIALVTSACALAFMIILDLWHKDEMFQNSPDITRFLQRNFSFLNFWFQFCTVPLFHAIASGSFTILFFSRNKADALFFFLAISTENIIGNILKMLYADSRPCFEYEDMAQLGCSCYFGKHSGHASSGNMFYTMLYYQFIDSTALPRKMKTAAFALLKFFVVSMCISRLYYGLHSYNQVLLGFCFGEFMVHLALALRRYKRLIEYTLNPLSEYQLALKDKFCKAVMASILGFALIALIIWYYRVTYFELSPYHPYANTSCRETCFQRPSQLLSSGHLMASGFYNASFFIFLLLSICSKDTAIPHSKDDQFVLQKDVLFKRFLVYLFSVTPLLFGYILSIEYGLFTYVFVTLTTLMFSVNLLFASSLMMKSMGCQIAGDFCQTERFSIVQENLNLHEDGAFNQFLMIK